MESSVQKPRLSRRGFAYALACACVGGAVALAADHAVSAAKPCTRCSGSGQVLGTCAVCGGSGKSDTGNPCQSCAGTGKRYKFCPTCSGSGSVPGADAAAALPPSCLFDGSRCPKSGGLCKCGKGCKCP